MAKAASVSIRLIGDKRLTRTLKRLPGKLQRKILRPALRAAASPIAKSMKRKAPKRSIPGGGQLKKSIGIRVVPQRKHRIPGGLVVDVGPRTGFKATVAGQEHDPQKIAHLVERGTENTRAQPFERPAFDENVAKAKQILAQRVSKGLAKAARGI